MRRRGSTYLLALLAVLALSAFGAGCGGDDDLAGSPDPPAQTTVPGDTGETGDTGDDATGEGEEQTFEIRDAGTVTLRADGGSLELVSVDPAPGWSHRVTEEEQREVEIDFVRDGRTVYEFEAELEDGRIETKVEREDED